ncbi:carboxypeptidase-like regulatory domain-containing protein [Hymenobacter convexus]|uniref:carboxypeptidase-like regulatory domain-containing protein n=1 Tax=Hymenobacter sp. CA1UV-4 TaxID=3063782 RepID=UPI002713E18F|nr:carboxypeptidase-like regulatory domain-containing protein [Hymenobacter sp. CA1UV-4]MDO7853615.1 carboxypeptidase-like regulatory domain-containing protein [Hymenobacter sp. CA1UV-4]
MQKQVKMLYVCIIQLILVLMQRITILRISPIVAVIALLLTSLPGRAQLAYNYMPRPTETAANTTEPEVGKVAVKTAMKMVHGVIQNEQGALPGATVWLQGSRTIAVTNAEGEFELQVPADAQTVQLICSYGGLQEQVLTLTPVQAMGSIYLAHNKKSIKASIAQ